MELRFSPLFSGSSGNSLYAGCDGGHLLIDAGVSCARIVAELRKIGISPAQLSGVLVTHEHIDHIRGVGVLSRKYDLPVFATEGTWAAMEDKLGGVAMKNMRVLEPMEDFYLGGMNITAFDIPHDAAQPVGYSIALGGARLSVATDIGCVRDSWMNAVAGSNPIMIRICFAPDPIHMPSNSAYSAAAAISPTTTPAARRLRWCVMARAGLYSAISARKTTFLPWQRNPAPWRSKRRACGLGRTRKSALPTAMD